MRFSTARASTPAIGQLELRGTSSRLVALLRERQKLLTNVTRKKSKLEQLSAKIDDQQVQMAQLLGKVQPLLVQGQAIDREIHELFASLLSKTSLKRKNRRLIQELYEMLQEGGTLSPATASGNDVFEFDDVLGRQSTDFETGEFPPHPGPNAEIPSAKRPAGSTATAMRDLFRRLANAIHPDKVQDMDSQERRTEAMKEVTRAYQEGDLARLIELEKAWHVGETTDLGSDTDETEQRCANLERTNRELKRQSKELDARLREIKRSAPVEIAAFLGLGDKNARPDDIVALIQHELESLQQLRDFVRSFHDGKITLDAFIAGPEASHAKELDLDEMPEDFDDFLIDLLMQSSFSEPTSRTPRRRRRR
jgi:hypothetical protein